MTYAIVLCGLVLVTLCARLAKQKQPRTVPSVVPEVNVTAPTSAQAAQAAQAAPTSAQAAQAAQAAPTLAPSPPPPPPDKTPVLRSEEDRRVFALVRELASSPLPYANWMPPRRTSCTLLSFQDIQHVLYINLEHRADRRRQCADEFVRLQKPTLRVDAIRCPVGALGCTLSHIKCLEHAKRNQWSHVWINEDDVQFTVSRKTLDAQVTEFLRAGIEWDVLLFHAVIDRATPISAGGKTACIRIRSAWCTTSYLVRSDYYDVLLCNFYEGAARLYRDPSKHDHIDEFWKSLQARDRWYLLYPLVGQQRISDSDIDHVPNKNLIGPSLQAAKAVVRQ